MCLCETVNLWSVIFGFWFDSFKILFDNPIVLWWEYLRFLLIKILFVESEINPRNSAFSTEWAQSTALSPPIYSINNSRQGSPSSPDSNYNRRQCPGLVPTLPDRALPQSRPRPRALPPSTPSVWSFSARLSPSLVFPSKLSNLVKPTGKCLNKVIYHL